MMIPQFGEVKVLVGAVLLRVAWLVTELVVSTILYMSGRKRD